MTHVHRRFPCISKRDFCIICIWKTHFTCNRLKELRRALTWTSKTSAVPVGFTVDYRGLKWATLHYFQRETPCACAFAGHDARRFLQAAGYIDNPSRHPIFLISKSTCGANTPTHDARTLQAIETVINCLHSASTAGAKDRTVKLLRT